MLVDYKVERALSEAHVFSWRCLTHLNEQLMKNGDEPGLQFGDHDCRRGYLRIM